jgi:site-specific recombinase XerD
MASFRFECDSRATRNGKHVIYLVVTANGKRKKLKSNIALDSVKQFNAKCKGDNWIRASVPEAKKWNQELHDLVEEAKEKFQDLRADANATASGVVAKMKAPEVSASFLKFAKERTDTLLKNGSAICNWKVYNSFLNKLQAYLKARRKHDLLFKELSVEMLTDFDSFLRRMKNVREPSKRLHPNTIHTTLKKFKALVHVAIKEKYMKPADDPFLTFEYALVKTEKEKLDSSELEALVALELEEGSWLWHARNYFFFSFYCAGIRVSDLIQLRWHNITSDGRLNYQMGKNHKVRDLVLVEQAKEILKHYAKEDSKATDFIFPLLDQRKPYAKAVTLADRDTMPFELQKQLFGAVSAKTALINKNLKQLAAMAGIEKKLSMHIARHSFAKLAKQKGVDNAAVKNLMAHSSLSVTEAYMGEFDSTETDKALSKMFSKPADSEVKKQQLQALLAGMSDAEIAALLASVGKTSTPLTPLNA